MAMSAHTLAMRSQLCWFFRISSRPPDRRPLGGFQQDLRLFDEFVGHAPT
ncbi:hypothetical protein C1Y40_03919 [Mycobacterium talmoniae]|uniref:Uncharacterized protein n=1 Tax=Mycobacterium talmoniae TaxID=1858794 RepID=A0A2S8BGW7_9MYCO|nr:hypothetical protein C1Y40_03919 [Mycobacterium talmoniae]